MKNSKKSFEVKTKADLKQSNEELEMPLKQHHSNSFIRGRGGWILLFVMGVLAGWLFGLWLW